jgi:hypothetical protein
LRKKPVVLLFFLLSWCVCSCEGNYIVKPDDRSCVGDASPCSKFPGASLCDSQDGCAWDFNAKVCVGNPIECEEFDDGDECERQAGCNWR